MVYLYSITNEFKWQPQDAADMTKVTLEVKQSTTTLATIEGRKVTSPGLFSGTVTSWLFYGVEEVIRTWFELTGLVSSPVATFTFRYGYQDVTHGASVINYTSESKDILYTDAKLNTVLTADDLIASKFLTARREVVLYGSPFLLFFYKSTGEEPVIGVNNAVTYYDKDGAVLSSTELSPTTSFVQVTVNPPSGSTKAKVTYNNRELWFYFAEAPVVHRFAFRNVFGVQEIVWIPASVVKSPDSEFETAKQGGKSVRYDIEHKLTIELKSAALPSALADAVLEMCRSKSVIYRVALVNGSTANRDVVITKYKIDQSDNPNSPRSVELSFEYADDENVTKVTI